MSRLALVLPALVLAVLPGADPPPAAAVDALVKRAGFTADGPGFALLVLHDGRPVLEKCHGLANLKTKTPITPKTTFELASLTKPFTATAVLLLAQRGQLALDDDVRKSIPELPPSPGRPVRLRDLLHHTSGLPEYLAFGGVKGTDPKYRSNADYLKEFEKHPAKRPPGEQFEYRNSNYMLLATVVSRVAKKTTASSCATSCSGRWA